MVASERGVCSLYRDHAFSPLNLCLTIFAVPTGQHRTAPDGTGRDEAAPGGTGRDEGGRGTGGGTGGTGPGHARHTRPVGTLGL